MSYACYSCDDYIQAPRSKGFRCRWGYAMRIECKDHTTFDPDTVQARDEANRKWVNLWYYRQCFLGKGGKTLTEVSYCPKCNWRFIEHYKLHPATHHGKLLPEKEAKKSAWQIFATEGLNDGKTLKDIAKLWKTQKETIHAQNATKGET